MKGFKIGGIYTPDLTAREWVTRKKLPIRQTFYGVEVSLQDDRCHSRDEPLGRVPWGLLQLHSKPRIGNRGKIMGEEQWISELWLDWLVSGELIALRCKNMYGAPLMLKRLVVGLTAVKLAESVTHLNSCVSLFGNELRELVLSAGSNREGELQGCPLAFLPPTLQKFEGGAWFLEHAIDWDKTKLVALREVVLDECVFCAWEILWSGGKGKRELKECFAKVRILDAQVCRQCLNFYSIGEMAETKMEKEKEKEVEKVDKLGLWAIFPGIAELTLRFHGERTRKQNVNDEDKIKGRDKRPDGYNEKQEGKPGWTRTRILPRPQDCRNLRRVILKGFNMAAWPLWNAEFYSSRPELESLEVIACDFRIFASAPDEDEEGDDFADYDYADLLENIGVVVETTWPLAALEKLRFVTFRGPTPLIENFDSRLGNPVKGTAFLDMCQGQATSYKNQETTLDKLFRKKTKLKCTGGLWAGDHKPPQL